MREINNENLNDEGIDISFRDPRTQNFRQDPPVAEKKLLKPYNIIARFLLTGLIVIVIFANCSSTHAQSNEQGAAGEPYANMPSIAPIGVRTGKYLDIPESSKGPCHRSRPKDTGFRI